LLVVVAAGHARVLAQPPALDDPLIYSVTPWEGQQDQTVMITGVNFGSAPEVRFNGNLATIVADRSDVGRILISVPGGGADGPLVVTNTDTGEPSNAADFRLVPGTYPEACTISGVVTDPVGVELAGAAVIALDPATETLAGAAVTAAFSGAYSIGLPAAGSYDLLFIPPKDSEYYQQRYLVACDGTRNHQFATGFELTGRVVSDVPAPIANAWVGVEGSGDFGSEALTDSGGEFFLYLPADSYDIEIVGPVGGRHIGTTGGPIVVDADTDLGDIALDDGVLVSGELYWQDGLDSGPLGGAGVAAFDSVGEIVGMTVSIADGSFFLPTTTGSDRTLFVGPGVYGLEELTVPRLDVTGDMELDYPLPVYSRAAQLPEIPTIIEAERLIVQERQRVIFDVARMRGSSIEVLFSDGGGGQIAGEETFAEQDRGGVVTTVPEGADTGDAVVRVDGVESTGFPLTVEPGIYSPGPFTTSGEIDDGSLAVADAFVGIFEVDCEGERLVDYDVTGPDGTYSVEHGAGDLALFVLPPISSGLARGDVSMLGTTGGGTRDVTLNAGHVVVSRCVDSGIGPVGSGDPIPDCEVGAEGIDVDYDDSMVSRNDGGMQLNLPTGTYEGTLCAPFRSRYVDADSSFFPIGNDVDLGDALLDSGYFIEGRIVDPLGDGLIGVEVTAYDIFLDRDAGRTRTVGPDGSFRLAVPPGVYYLFPSVRDEQEYWVAPVTDLFVNQDVQVYPALEAQAAGHIRGTVVDDSAIPIDELPVAAYHDLFGFVRQTDTCPDGSYDLKVPAGDYAVQARPSFDDLCLADEFYDDHYEGCGADLVSVTVPGTVNGIDFALAPAGTISGTVVGASGPLGYVTVCATNGLTNPTCYHGCTSSEPDGTYVLPNVPAAADYRVDATGPGYPWECWDGYPDCTDYDPVSVGDCAETSGIQFHALPAPGPVPDGWVVAGDRLSARWNAPTGEIVIEWQPTCDADDHAIYFGALGEFAAYTWAACDAGMSGSYSLFPPGGDLFFVVVGQSGALEGSYGYDGNLAERPHSGGLCGTFQDLTATCVP
jgi:hypothetical protein